jgi:hypothetical protein
MITPTVNPIIFYIFAMIMGIGLFLWAIYDTRKNKKK